MKKVLLIEDRYKRQQLFKKETGIDLEKYSDILDNCIEDKYNTFLNEMLIDNFDLGYYDVIITHKSAFGADNDVILTKLTEHCKKNAKPLVLFSGGIVGNYYNREVYEVLELNSKTFYSQNLTLFLDAIKEKNDNLLMLSYRKQWQLNIILNVIESLNLYIDTKDIELRKYIDIDSLEPINLVNKTIDLNGDMEKIIDFRDGLLNIVKDVADE
jgi:hypothetical protein